MCERISGRGEERFTQNANKELRYYSITAHQLVLVSWLIIISLLLIFIFSLFIGGIERLYQEWDGMWAAEVNGESSTSGLGFNLGVLPDFLGGMIGILVGFFLEWLIFEKIKNLSKYRTIISCLNLEFEKIKEVLDLHTYMIREIIIDDIVLSAESSVIIYNLPHFCVFIRSIQGEKILSLLQEIHGAIENRNYAIEYQSIAECDKLFINKNEVEDYKNKGWEVKEDEQGNSYIKGEPFVLNERGGITNTTWDKKILDDIDIFMCAIKKDKTKEKH